MRHWILGLCIALGAMALTPPLAAAGPTLDHVRANGKLRCGVGEGLPGFTRKNEAGQWQGFGADFARAVAAAAAMVNPSISSPRRKFLSKKPMTSEALATFLRKRNCHSEHGEESRIFKSLRSFTSFTMTK